MISPFLAAAIVAATPAVTIPVPDTFTYQGELVLNGQPVDGNADFIIRLYDGPSIESSVARNNVTVDNGLFSFDLGFAPEFFDGTNYELEIAARSPAGSGSYTTLSPRQPLRTTPYAFHSNTADTLLAPATIEDGSNSLDGIISTAVRVDSTRPIGLAGYGSNFGLVGIIDQSSATANAAGVLGQVFGGSPGQISVWALNSFAGTEARLADDVFAADFIGPVRTNDDLSVEGDIIRSYSQGTFDIATPIAYGFIDFNGSVASATPNVSSTYNAGSMRYEISIDNENYFFSSYVTVVTTIESDQIANTGSGSGRLFISLEDRATGAQEQGRFQFVTYKPGGAAEVKGRNRPALQPLDPTIPTDELFARPAPMQPRQPIVEDETKPAGALRD